MQKVWITGASSGIGLACALRYASRGAQVVLTALPVTIAEPPSLTVMPTTFPPKTFIRPSDFTIVSLTVALEEIVIMPPEEIVA